MGRPGAGADVIQACGQHAHPCSGFGEEAGNPLDPLADTCNAPQACMVVIDAFKTSLPSGWSAPFCPEGPPGKPPPPGPPEVAARFKNGRKEERERRPWARVEGAGRHRTPRGTGPLQLLAPIRPQRAAPQQQVRQLLQVRQQSRSASASASMLPLAVIETGTLRSAALLCC